MVATAAYPQPIQKPTQSFPFTDQNGNLTQIGMNTISALWAAVNGANLIIPCTCLQASTNVLALTPLVTSPVTQQNSSQAGVYTVYSTWAFVAQKTSTGLLTANVSPLASLNVYKTNGSAQATTGDVTINLQYFLTYVDTLNSNAGGFVLR